MFHKEIEEIKSIAYMVIPYVEYKRLINSQREVKNLQEQLNKQLKYKPIPGARREEPPDEESPATVGEIPAESKKGAGDVSPSLESNTTSKTVSAVSPDLVQTIVSMVLNQLPSVTATGRGNQDLTPLPPGALPATVIDPITAKVEESSPGSPQEHSNNENNVTFSTGETNSSDSVSMDDTDRQLIKTVSPSAQKNAALLLCKLKDHSADLHVNSDGSIFIDGQELPNANMFKLFKYLFKPTHYGKHEHLQTIVNEISSLGLGSLISRFYSAGITPKGSYAIKNRHEIHKNLKERSLPWYHVGHDE